MKQHHGDLLSVYPSSPALKEGDEGEEESKREGGGKRNTGLHGQFIL